MLRMRPTRGGRTAAGLFSAVVLLGCDNVASSPTAGPALKQPATAESTAPPIVPKGPPELLVDANGPFLGGQRVDLAANGGAEKLAKIVGELPIKGQPVTLTAEKKAKVTAVAAVVNELGKNGVARVTIKTDGRDDLPKEIVVTPEDRISSPPGCSVAAMVLKDLATAVWPIKGGVGKRHRKGFAGPDLSHTSEALKKDIAACDSPIAFFSVDESVPWEMAFNLAGTMLLSDEKKKVDTLVLLGSIPVAGRPVGIGSQAAPTNP